MASLQPGGLLITDVAGPVCNDAAVTEHPEPSVVEWGRVPRLAGAPARWRRPAVWLLAALGAAAMFGSMVLEWQVIDEGRLGGPPGGGLQQGVGAISAWGTSWLIGAMALAVCVVLSLAAPPTVRAVTRLAGLAVSAVLVFFLAGAAVDLGRSSPFFSGSMELEPTLGRGLFLAFASVGLLATALWLSPGDGPDDRPMPWRRRDTPDGPAAARADLTVTAAEPLTYPGDRHELR